MELFPGVHRIESVFGDRALYQYLFLGQQTILVDTGICSTPVDTIFPYFESIGIKPQAVSLALVTHPDLDHHGGLPAIKDASPATLLACGQQDAAQIQDNETLYRDRYNFLAVDHGLGFGREGMSLCPETRKMDILLTGGEVIEPAPGWQLRIWHVPGHSAGHLAIYDQKHRAAFTSDAVQAGGYPTIDGGMAFGPTYYTVSTYLSTIRFLEGQPIEHLFGGHWPAMHGAEVQVFLEDSRLFVERAEELLMGFLRSHPDGVTLRDIVDALGPRLGDWPREAAPFLQFALHGHVSALCEAKRLIAGTGRPIEYRLP
jgi:glyoxylase-like metal-dependent hydrolase (beta-lactamase superfamily II)